jgi:DNA polymerase-1
MEMARKPDGEARLMPRDNKPSEGDILTQVERRLASEKVVAVDTETTGLDWRHDKIVGYVLNFGKRPQDGYYLPVRHDGGANFDVNKVVSCIKPGFARNDLRKVFFSASFDLKFMHADGVTIEGPIEDTQINAFLIDERQPGFSLDSCCEFAKVTPKKGEDLYQHMAMMFGGDATRKAQMGNYWKLAGDDEFAVDYALGDGVSTWDLWDAQQEQLDTQELRTVWDVECRLIPVLSRMMIQGIRIDEERLMQVKFLVQKRIETLLKKLPPKFNVNAPTQLTKLFKDKGVPIVLTEKGNPTFTEAILERTEVGRDIIAVRKLTHLDQSFFGPLVERHIWKGRVHCNFNQTRGEEFGTITGRLSCNDPNLQQVHKRNKLLGSIFRSIFLPDPGLRWVSCDYKQIEPKLLAHYGSVQVLLDGYRADPPIDAHGAVAAAAGIDRETGKRLNQAMLTGAGNAKIAMMLGVPQAEADSIIEAYHGSMPEIKKLQSHAKRVMLNRGYVKSVLGRRSRLDDERFAYTATNRILQMSNADILKKSMVEIDDYLKTTSGVTSLIHNIHDDIGFQYEAVTEKPIMDRCVEIMCDYGPGRSVELELDMSVDRGEGKDWAEATYGLDTVKKQFEIMEGRY